MEPEEKIIVTNGRKPKLASGDPFFQLVWKQVATELKRSICFANPFPDTTSYELLPMNIYSVAARRVSRLDCFEKEDERERARREWSTAWGSGVSHHNLQCDNS